MRSWLLPGVLGLLLPGLAAAAPTWHGDFAAAQMLARESGKPMFLVFRCVP
jgi:hypothetical protein